MERICKINVREYRRGNQKWTIQRNWQHRDNKPNPPTSTEVLGENHRSVSKSKTNLST
jgi:hypothetical protein